MGLETHDGRWIFGYGSLVWRPSFPFRERRPACLPGFARRFWQGSTDHRGVPQAPGRVVTLCERPGALCWGMAYRLDDAARERVLEALDWREKGGYERVEVDLHVSRAGTRDDRRENVPGLVYLATPDNPNYLGPAPLPEIARQVRRSHGPSGSNLEYVLRLAESLREIDADDPHVFELESLLRADAAA